jgi:hypothetical protein
MPELEGHRIESVSAVAFAHHKIDGAENCNDIADHVAREDFWKNAEIDKAGRANF